MVFFEEQGQLHGIPHSAAGVAAHQIGDEIKLLAFLLADALEAAQERLVDIDMGLAHFIQHTGAAMLRRYFKLPADVVAHQFGEEGIVLLAHHVIVAQAAADKYLFDAGDGPQFPQKLDIIGVVHPDGRATGGGQAFFILAQAVGGLLSAGGGPEIGGGAAHIVDIALEVGIVGKAFGFPQQRGVAAGGDVAPLMERDRAEIAGAKAAAVVGKGKFDLFNGGNAAHFLIDGVVVTLVGQFRHSVQFLGGKGQSGRILHQVPLPVLLHHGPAGHMVLLLQLKAAGTGVGLFILRYLIEGGAGDGVFRQGVGKGAKIAGSADIPHSGRVFPSRHAGGNFGHLVLAHAVDEKVRAGIRQNGGTHSVIPVIVVGKAAQGGFQPADDDGDIAVGLANEAAVDDGGAVGAQPCPAAGGIEILAAQAAGGGIVGDH